MKRIKTKWIVVASVFAGLLVFLTMWPWFFHEQIEQAARDQIKKKLEADVSFAHLDLSLWKHFPDLTVTLEDLTIVTREADRDTLLSSKEIAVSVRVYNYLTEGGLDITGIFVDSPRLFAHVESDGSANFSIVKKDTAAVTDTASISVDLHLNKILLKNATIRYRDELTDSRIEASQLDFEGSGDFESTYFDTKVIVDSRKTSLRWKGQEIFQGKDIDISTTLAADRKKNVYTIQENKITINSFSFLANGTVQTLENGIAMDVVFSSSKTTLAELMSLANIVHNNIDNVETNGNVAFNGFIKGNYIPGTDSVPRFRLDVEVKNGMAKLDTLHESLRDIHFDFTLSNNTGHRDSTTVQMDSIFFRMDEHTVQGHAHLHHLVDSEIDAFLTGSVHAEEVLKVFPVPGIKARGELNFKIEVVGKYATLKWPEVIPHIDFDIDMQKGYLKYDSMPDSLSQVSFHLAGHVPQGDWRQSELKLEKLSLLAGDNPVTGNVKIIGLDRPNINGKFKAAVHLEDIAHIFPVRGMSVKGSLRSEIEISGVYDSVTGKFPNINGTFNLENGFYQTDAYPNPLEQIQVSASLKNTNSSLETAEVIIHGVKYTLEGEQFELSGTIRDLKKVSYDLAARGTIDLAKVSKFIALDDYTLAGKIIADLKAGGTLVDLEQNRYDKTKASGSITLRNIAINGKKLPKPVLIPSADFTLTPEVLHLNAMKIATGRTKLSLQGELHDYFCFFTQDEDKVLAKLQVQADTLDLNAWKNAFTTVDAKQPSLETPNSSQSVWQVPVFMDFDLDSDIKHLLYEDMVISDMAGEILMKDGVMTMNESGFNTLNARFQANGTYDTRKVNHPHFDFQLDIKALDIQKAYKEVRLVRELAPAAGTAEGLFSINYSLSGELEPTMHPNLKTLVGKGDIHIANAKINGMKMFEHLSREAKKNEINDPHLRDFTVSSEIKDSKIYVKPFKLKVSGFNTEIEGMSEMSGKIDYMVYLQVLPLVKLPFHVTGTTDKPVVKMKKDKEKDHTI